MINTDDLIELKQEIEKLSKYHQLKVFEIFLLEDIKYSENNNGIFILLNKISKKLYKKLKEYINYVNLQENIINQGESKINNFKKILSKYKNKNIAVIGHCSFFGEFLNRDLETIQHCYPYHIVF